MQESTQIAYSYVQTITPDPGYFEKNLVHLHVPAGATPKDGPSAGITMALALYSLAVNRPIKQGLAMTGELTLTGKILPIGGLREKTIAARRVNTFELIFPTANKNDFDSLPEYLKSGLTVHFAKTFGDVVKIAFT